MLVLSVNAVFLLTYIILMTLMLVKVKCQLPRTAMIVVFAYLLVFLPKVIYDGLRVANIDETFEGEGLTDIIYSVGDKTKDIILQYFMMYVDRIRIKL